MSDFSNLLPNYARFTLETAKYLRYRAKDEVKIGEQRNNFDEYESTVAAGDKARMAMVSIYGLRAVRLVAAFIALSCVLPLANAHAQASTSMVTGSAKTATGAPVAGASVLLRGATSQQTTTDAQGAFSFSSVAPGVYQIVVTKPGYFQYIASIATVAGSTVNVSVTLAAQSFTSLREIAHASTNTPGRAPINQSVAAISVITNQQFQDQGQLQVMKLLNETPGIISWVAPGSGNGADADSAQVIQIRGALPYETETLIDGHPTVLSLTGAFNPTLLNPAMLQSVEVVKGPGSMPVEINYAIGGTVNFITLEPTRTPQGSITTGIDNYDGISTAFRFTGSTPSNFLQYAIAYATNGSPGPMVNYQLPGSAVFLVAGTDWTVNGQELLSAPVGEALAPAESYNRYIAPVGEIRYAEPFYVCCYGYNTDFDSKNELGKLRLNFSQESSLTLSFLGAQDFGHTDNTGVAESNAPVGQLGGSAFSSFEPPAGYTGSVPAGTQIPFDLSSFAPGFGSSEQYLYQAEFRTTLGQWTALARYYDGGNIDYEYFNNASTSTFGFTGNAWGGGLLCPKGTTFNGVDCDGQAPVMTYFNGQLTTFLAQDATNSSLTDNHELGESLQFARPFNNGSNLTLSVDRTGLSACEFINVPTSGLPPYYSLPPGASQTFTTESARFNFFVAPFVQATVADYAVQYESHYTDNGGGLLPGDGPASWHDATRGYNAPRLALTWQPNDDTSWRLAVGSSIAPPVLADLSSAGTAPGEIINGVPTAGFIQNLNNGSIAPETAFGYDIGVDKRFHRSMFVSFDAYLTTLRNMYLPSTFLVNQDYDPPGCPAPGECPLYGSSTENLGHARYEGIEAAIGNAPAVGFGFRLQGDLMRAYAYDLPQGFYCTNVPASQCTPFNYNTNLGILPGINFQQSGLGYNSINGAAVPYSMGYGELNLRTANGSFYQLGVTYFGPNNAYSEPPFFVVSAGIHEALGKNLVLQITGDNLTNSNDALWSTQFGGIPAVLAPECVGKYGGPAYTAQGTECTALVNLGLVPRSAVAVVPQEGPTTGTNYGPATFRLQLIEKIGGP